LKGESRYSLGEWTLAQLTRALSIEHGTRYPTFLELRAEFEPELCRPDAEELLDQNQLEALLNELGGPHMPINGISQSR